MTRLTRSGIYVRQDPSLGLLAYSPFTGLLFACLDDKPILEQLTAWLDRKKEVPPHDCYRDALGPGWSVSMAKARFPRSHVLSSSNLVPHSHKPASLLVINWLISGRCMCKCKYCYSSDIMSTQAGLGRYRIAAIANQILSYEPLAVVLTGGEPLLAEELHKAIDILHGRTGILIDTNGMPLTKAVVRLLKRYRVFVRVSLDSEIPKINNELRPSDSGCTLAGALAAVNLCLDNGVGVGVQTVVTKHNMSDLEALGNKLFRLGITNWRLQVLVKHSLFADYKKFEANLKRFRESICPVLGEKNRGGWDEKMSIQPVNTPSNAVVLVAPDGRFLTELNGKVPLWNGKPFNPSMDEILKGPLDLDAHATRYLNIGG